MSKKQDEIHYEYERDCDLSYPKQRVGRKSSNPIIAVLDWLHRDDKYFLDLPTSLSIINLVVCVCLCVWFFIDCNGDGFFMTILFGIIFYHVCILLTIPVHLYRHYRHKYFKKHNLPGPYGWGTLDKTPRFTKFA